MIQIFNNAVYHIYLNIMQKIEFIHFINELTTRLKSDQIVDYFLQGFANPNTAYNYGVIRPLLFESKSQFDQLMIDQNKSQVLNKITGIGIYEDKMLADLSTVLQHTAANQIMTNKRAIDFFSFHSSLLSLKKISSELLANRFIINADKENIDLGIIVFQVHIDDEGLETSKYIKILSALDDLVKVIEKANRLEESVSEIVILDSGSNTNIGLESKVEVARSIFLIFKEVWDFITSFQFYRMQKRNQALMESLTIRKELHKSVEEGILTENEAKEYIHIIKTRTDELIGLKVLPRALTSSDQKFDNNRILDEYRIRMLEEKNEK